MFVLVYLGIYILVGTPIVMSISYLNWKITGKA